MKNFKTLFTALFLTFLATGALAQDKAAAIKAFNAGLEQAKSNDFDAAISSFTQAADIAGQVGDDALKDRAEKQIPTMYYQKAVLAYNAFKTSKNLSDLDTAVNAFQEASDVASQYGVDNVAARASGIIPQLLYNKSLVQFNQGNYAEADATLNEVINKNANYAIAYYQKGLVANKQGKDILQVLQWYDKAIEVADRTNQAQVSRRATESAHDNLLYRGVKEMEAGNHRDALELLQTGLSYDSGSADIHYRIAEVSNKMAQYDTAIKHAIQSLDLENGGRTDKAKIYFELGFAYQAKGDKAKACDAFSNAVYGAFKDPAEHKMEFELKCSSADPSN
ncbi:tetratricopeptide repeat protein [Balneola sp. MJW-20]|uniref:tetratricopeptide repeat protein n=1 Tax=Gracilimonas aurantiaca TaxID=3234185 RepID=UPI003465E10F